MKNTDSDVSVTQADEELAETIMRRVRLTIEHTLGKPCEVSHNGLPELLARHRLQSDTAKDARIEAMEGMMREIHEWRRAKIDELELGIIPAKPYCESEILDRIDALLKGTEQ